MAGVPLVRAGGSAGCSTSRSGAKDGETQTTLARATWDGTKLVGAEDLLIGASAARTSEARLAFGRDGIINMSTGAPFDDNAQSPGSLYGKVLRVTMDGEAPADNPFVGKPGRTATCT